MSSTHSGSLQQHACAAQKPMNNLVLAGAVTVVIIAATVFVASFAETFIAAGPQQEALAQCAAVTADAERLACYDALGKQALRAPAKGANAPVAR